MQRVKVKICGLLEEEHLLAAAAAGADYVGLVFAPSKRRIDPVMAEHLRQVLARLDNAPSVVGVFVNELWADVNAIAERCGLDIVQLSGEEDSDYCEKMVRPVIKTIRVFPTTTIDDIAQQIGAIRRHRGLQSVSFLLDTGGETRGGTGRAFDWRLAREVSAFCPVLVAGGLDPLVVRGLVSRVRPLGVDVSTGVERDGRKDTTLIRAFVDAVREAEQENDNGDNNAS